MKKIFQLLLFVYSLMWSMAVFAEQVDINTADATTLAQTIDGIGLKKAEAIVAYRKANGPFVRVDDLTKVKGIGEKTIQANRANLIVSSNK